MRIEDVISNAEVFGIERSFRESKYPMATDVSQCTCELTNRQKSLAATPPGTGHNSFLKGIVVRFDLTFTVKAWIEGERYHWFEPVSSQSTMHRISKMDYSKCMIGYVTDNMKAELERLRDIYIADPTPENYLVLLYNCPVGLKLTAGMVSDYLALKTIYAQRKTHRLPEWRAVCEWIESLPYSYMITGEAEEDAD